MSEPSAAVVYRSYVEAETRRDEEGMTAMLAPDISIELNGVPALGSAAEDAAAMAALFAAYPDYHREILESWGRGPRPRRAGGWWVIREPTWPGGRP